MKGTIVRIVDNKGFGFLKDENGKEYFFHYSGTIPPYTRLEQGNNVEFDEEKSDRGPRACNVRVE